MVAQFAWRYDRNVPFVRSRIFAIRKTKPYEAAAFRNVLKIPSAMWPFTMRWRYPTLDMGQSENLPGILNLSFVEALYQDYVRDPSSVPPDWRSYFQGISDGNGSSRTQRFAPDFRQRSIFNPPSNGHTTTDRRTDAVLQERVDQLIRNYRVRGHVVARVDPLDVPRAKAPELEPEFWGFTEADMDRRFSCES